MPAMGSPLSDGLDGAAREFAAAGFAALWHGRALPPEALLRGRPEEAGRALAELVGQGRAEVDDAGRVVGVHGLTLRPTRHCFITGGDAHHTWCAFDAVGIPAALALDAEVRTTCRTCDGLIRLPLVAGRPEPSEAALWLPAPAVRHLLSEFCAAADLYCTVGHLQRRIDPARAPGEVLDVATTAARGRTAWADVADVGPGSAR
jgi:alkylmercury lyase